MKDDLSMGGLSKIILGKRGVMKDDLSMGGLAKATEDDGGGMKRPNFRLRHL